MWVIGPYEIVWVTAALVFLILAPPLMGLCVAYVRARRKRLADERAEREAKSKES